MQQRDAKVDLRIVNLIKRGDSSALHQLFDDHFISLVDYAASFLRSTDAAEDLVADIFSWIVANPEKFSPSQSVRAYLLWMVRNRSLDVIRGEKREQSRYAEISNDTEPILADESVLRDDENTRIMKALDSLAPVTRSIVLLRLRQELEYSEIAQVVGLSETAVRMQLSRALRIIRERLG